MEDSPEARFLPPISPPPMSPPRKRVAPASSAASSTSGVVIPSLPTDPTSATLAISAAPSTSAAAATSGASSTSGTSSSPLVDPRIAVRRQNLGLSPLPTGVFRVRPGDAASPTTPNTRQRKKAEEEARERDEAAKREAADRAARSAVAVVTDFQGTCNVEESSSCVLYVKRGFSKFVFIFFSFLRALFCIMLNP